MKKILLIILMLFGFVLGQDKKENKENMNKEEIGSTWGDLNVKWGMNTTINYPIIVPNYEYRRKSVKLVGFTHVYEDTVFVISIQGDTLKVK